MKLYTLGKVISVGKQYIIFEANNTGSIVYVADASQFKEDEEIRLYTFDYQSEYSSARYGFKNMENKVLFENLLSVNGFGPKSALELLKVKNISKIISSGDITALKSLSFINDLTAEAIIAKTRDRETSEENEDKQRERLNDCLVTLGFSEKQRSKGLDAYNPEEDIAIQVENAIKLISETNQER